MIYLTDDPDVVTWARRRVGVDALSLLEPTSESGSEPHLTSGHAAPGGTATSHPSHTHGDTRVDDWYWLRDQDDPDVIAYLEAENAYTSGA